MNLLVCRNNVSWLLYLNVSCETPNYYMKRIINFDIGKTQAVSFDPIVKSVRLIVKTDRSLFGEKSSCKMLGLSVNSKLDLVLISNVVFNTKTGSWLVLCSSFLPRLSFISMNLPSTLVWGLIWKLQKLLCRAVSSVLALQSSRKCCQSENNWSLYVCRYYFGKYSLELAELVLDTFFWEVYSLFWYLVWFCFFCCCFFVSALLDSLADDDLARFQSRTVR